MDLFIKNVSAANVSIQGEYGFGGFISLGKFVNTIMPIAFSVAGLMVAFYFIIGAFELVTSQGDKAHIVSARAKIYHAIIGLILLLIIYFVLQYVFDTLLIDPNKPRPGSPPLPII